MALGETGVKLGTSSDDKKEGVTGRRSGDADIRPVAWLSKDCLVRERDATHCQL